MSVIEVLPMCKSLRINRQKSGLPGGVEAHFDPRVEARVAVCVANSSAPRSGAPAQPRDSAAVHIQPGAHSLRQPGVCPTKIAP
jgi:hypothetical protein